MTTMIYLVQATFDARRLYEWTRVAGVGADPDYAIHAALRAAFGDAGPQPWARRPGPTLTVLGYADVDAAQLLDAARFYADPGLAAALVDVQTKAMPTLPAGRVVGFNIRVRPIARRRDRNERVYEQDVAYGDPDRSLAYRDWLARHLAGVAELLRCDLTRFTMARNSRRFAGAVRPVPGMQPDATLAGVLRVTDERAFAMRLRRGIGRHKAFGYGALLLRPVRSDQ